MKLKITLPPEDAAILRQLYESGQLDDIGVTELTETEETHGNRQEPVDEEEGEAAGKERNRLPEISFPSHQDVRFLPKTILGRAVVIGVLNDNKDGKVFARCRVAQGKVTTGANARVIRNGIVIFPEGSNAIAHMNVMNNGEPVAISIQQGQVCVIGIDGYTDIKPDDFIEAYEFDLLQVGKQEE